MNITKAELLKKYLAGKEDDKRYYKKHREKVLMRVKKYQQDNKEKIKEYKQKWWLKNRIKILKNWKIQRSSQSANK